MVSLKEPCREAYGVKAVHRHVIESLVVSSRHLRIWPHAGGTMNISSLPFLLACLAFSTIVDAELSTNSEDLVKHKTTSKVQFFEKNSSVQNPCCDLGDLISVIVKFLLREGKMTGSSGRKVK